MAVDKYGFVEVGGLSRISNVSSLTNPQGNLILSSSLSTVHISGGLKFSDLPSDSVAIGVPPAARFKVRIGANLGGFLLGHQNSDGRVAIVNNADNRILWFDATNNMVNAQTSHLILSSTAGSLVSVSGNLKVVGYTSATLPSPVGNADVPSGTIGFVTNLGNGFPIVALNGAWHRLATGSF
jgi:hypothetical protein